MPYDALDEPTSVRALSAGSRGVAFNAGSRGRDEGLERNGQGGAPAPANHPGSSHVLGGLHVELVPSPVDDNRDVELTSKSNRVPRQGRELHVFTRLEARDIALVHFGCTSDVRLALAHGGPQGPEVETAAGLDAAAHHLRLGPVDVFRGLYLGFTRGFPCRVPHISPSTVEAFFLRRCAPRADDALALAAFNVNDCEKPAVEREPDEEIPAVSGSIVDQEVARVLEGRDGLLERHAVLEHVGRGLGVVPLEIATDDRCHTLELWYRHHWC